MEDYDPFASHLSLKLDQDAEIKWNQKPKSGESPPPPLLIGTDGEGTF